MCDRLLILNLYTTTYHLQSNVKAERFNRTLLASLCVYVTEHPKFCTEYWGAITHAYNTQVHGSTGVPPFNQVLSNPQLTMLMENEIEPDASLSTTEYREHFLMQLHRRQFAVRCRLTELQCRDKPAHDHRVHPAAPYVLYPGEYAYLKRP